MREPAPLLHVDRTYVRLGRRRLSFFSGCDYFRLSSHPKIVAAFQTGIRKFGLTVAASRMTTGNHALYCSLEKRLARFFQTDDARLVSNGYLTNLVVAQALAGNFSHALIDSRAHPSLVDAASFLDCPILQFQHRDPNAVAAAIRRCGPGARVVLLTDGLFARDGSVPPLADYLKLLPPDGVILVDDAHGGGILGSHGRGSVECAGVDRRRIIQTITLSKAFGVYGGAILGNADLRTKISRRSKIFIGSTPLLLPAAHAALEAVNLLGKEGRRFRRDLEKNVSYVRSRLARTGLVLASKPGPFVALAPRGDAAVRGIKQALLRAGIYPPFVQYPGAPEGGFFRFVISSEHNKAQLDALITAVSSLADDFLPL